MALDFSKKADLSHLDLNNITEEQCYEIIYESYMCNDYIEEFGAVPLSFEGPEDSVRLCEEIERRAFLNGVLVGMGIKEPFTKIDFKFIQCNTVDDMMRALGYDV